MESSSLVTILLNLPLSKVITVQGRRSLAYFMINSRVPNIKIKQVNINEFGSIERFCFKLELGIIIRTLLAMPNRIETNFNANEAYPTKKMTLVVVSSLSSKDIRCDLTNEEEKIICLYKIGVALDPGEVLSWTSKVKKLTSTRHKNILLRMVHGDIFSNSRLFKFGLRNSPNCANCHENVETIQHRVNECPKAIEAWTKLNSAKRQLGLKEFSDLSLESLIGAKERPTKIELALNAELILRMTSESEGYCPAQIVRASIKLIGNSEPVDLELKNKIRTYLERN